MCNSVQLEGHVCAFVNVHDRTWVVYAGTSWQVSKKPLLRPSSDCVLPSTRQGVPSWSSLPWSSKYQGPQHCPTKWPLAGFLSLGRPFQSGCVSSVCVPPARGVARSWKEGDRTWGQREGWTKRTGENAFSPFQISGQRILNSNSSMRVGSWSTKGPETVPQTRLARSTWPWNSGARLLGIGKGQGQDRWESCSVPQRRKQRRCSLTDP